jgi:6-phosphogluconolactonase
MIVVVMGVSGSGKTTIGTLLAEALRCAFLDADSLHSDANVGALHEGRPLTDADRAPWLDAVHARLLDASHRGDSLVVACSALKESYRRVLSRGVSVTWVSLRGDALDEPSETIVPDVSPPPAAIVQEILSALRDRPDIRVLPDLNTLSLRAAETAVGIINDAVRLRGRCSLVLSGGGTPMTLHRLLASTFRDRIPWSLVDVFWGDERYVPHADALSNYRMARETLLDHVPCPPANVHPMPTHFSDPDEAARDYQATLERYWGDEEPCLDLVLLGMGPDGHTASLFPGSEALRERTRWVVAATAPAPAESPRRLTLTLRAFARSAHAHFLVTGAEKATVLERVLSGSADPTVYPAAAIRPAQGWLVWWLDRPATTHQEE